MRYSAHIFMKALKSASFKEEMRRSGRLPKLLPLPPYSLVVDAIASIDGEVSDEDFLTIIRMHLHGKDVEILNSIDTVSPALAAQATEALEKEAVIKDIQDIVLEGRLDAVEKMREVSRLISVTQAIVAEPRAKKVGELSGEKKTPAFTFLRYPHYKGRYHMYAAYPGQGKTTLCLAAADYCIKTHGYKVLYICVGDWDEASLGGKIGDKLPDLWVALYSKATLYEVEVEIDTVKPDVCIIDSMTNLTTFFSEPDRYYMELGSRAKALRDLAVKYDVCMVGTHQLMRISPVVSPEDLMGAKAHVLAELDLCLGIGGDLNESSKTVSTLKLRHDPPEPTFRVDIDYEDMFVYDV